MGFCSGTDIFDPVVWAILNEDIEDDVTMRLITALTMALEDHDWDCQSDSEYRTNWFVHEVFKQLHPDWFEDEVNE